mgnify:CR=1 FL=1
MALTMAENGSNGNGFEGTNGAPFSVARGESPAVSELTTPSARTCSSFSLTDIRRVEDVSVMDIGLADAEAIFPVRRV